MLFAIDIGNTNIHLGIFEKNELKQTFNISTQINHSSDEYSLIFKLFIKDLGYALDEIEAIILSSVVPQKTKNIKDAISKISKAPIMLIGPGIKTGFSIKLDDPAELGADLVCNTAGAINKVGAPCIVVDFGTAITVSVVSNDKSFIGCSIMPGIQMGFDALHSTGLLPNVSFDKTASFIGKNSINSMRSGVCYGSVMACEGFIDTFKKELDLSDDIKIVVSGGYAKDLLSHFKSKVTYIENLTLQGLNVIYNLNKKR